MAVQMCKQVVSFVVLATLLATAEGKNKSIYVLSLLPYPQPDPMYNPSWAEGPAVSVGLELARTHINNQTDILPDYSIELLHHDGGCEFTTRAYVGFWRSLYSSANDNKRVVGIVGPGCSSDSIAVSSVASNENIALITVHGGGSPLLSDRVKHRYALGTLGSTESFARIAAKIMTKSGWSAVGVLYDSSRLFYFSTARRFVEILSDIRNNTRTNLNIEYLSPVYADTYLPLDDIFNRGLRVNFLFTPVRTTQQILCLAFHSKMVFRAYQWLVASNTFEDLRSDVSFTYRDQSLFCSEANMTEVALKGVSFLNYELMALNQTAPSTYSRLTSAEYDQLYRDTIDEYNIQGSSLNRSNISYTVWSTYFYDALWAWAVALDNLTRNNPDLDLTEYEHGDQNMTDMILDEFYRLNFLGVSGQIRFNEESGFLNRVVSVYQVTNGSAEIVATYDGQFFENRTVLKFISDHFEDRIFSIHAAGVSVFFIITSLQLIALIVLHVLTIRYRFYHSVKASSPKLIQLTYIGSYMFVFTILLYTVRVLRKIDDTTTSVLCNLSWAWLIPICFTLTFGTVAARTWRLYRIFTHYLNPGRFIGDYYLMAFVFILLAVDVVIGILWVTIDPQQAVYRNYTETEGVATFQVLYRTCTSVNPYWTLGLVASYKTVLLIVVVILAILTRNIQNQSFTTKSLRVLVYLFSGVMVVGFLLYYLFSFYSPLSSLSFVVIMIMFNIMLFLFLTLIFLPPVLPMLREKFNERFPHFRKKMENAETYSETESIPVEGTSRFYI